MRSVCVFCGSSSGRSAVYREAAAALGTHLAEQQIDVVYGGGAVGLMGVVADAALAAGGRVTGVIPRHLVDRELAHDGLTDLRITTSMHERKALMADLADGFIALPGGLGTLEELAEVVTWAQLGLHSKPIGLLDVDGFFDLLLQFVDNMVTEGFLQPSHRSLLVTGTTAAGLLASLESWSPPTATKWAPRGDGELR